MPETTPTTSMRLSWTAMLLLSIVLFALGAFTVLGFQEMHARGVPSGWLDLAKTTNSIGVADDALLKASLPFPGGTFDGKARFVPVGNGEPAERLGYLMHVAVPQVAAPKPAAGDAAEGSPKPAGGGQDVIISGFTDAVYEGTLTFTLKDADGFIIDRLSSPGEKLVAGRDNMLQGFATQPETDHEAARVHVIVVELTINRCLSCAMH